MTSRLAGTDLVLDVPMEPLSPGPVGEQVKVVDFHAPSGTWLSPVDLDDPAVIHQDGLRPSESDPRSHQQIVYAVASSVIERFERFLGRRLRWAPDRRLRLVPHAFEGRNAYYDPTRQAVLFGYFDADERSPGRNLPGQRIFTCLSFDIVAHEVTHALIHRLRKYYLEPTNPDVLAWHEACADLVALFQHFMFTDVVRNAVQESRGDLTAASGLFDLASEFGESTGRGAALREALERSDPRTPASPAAAPGEDAEPGRGERLDDYHRAIEPHDRGTVFVRAVFEGFVATYRSRIADLLRIATGGTGVLPEGHIHPDLAERVAEEASRTADRYLGMVIRAFDYMPVVDVTFGDVVRAIVTADRDLHPDDGDRLRATLVESFRSRGIYPEHATSLAEEALAWPQPPPLQLSPRAVAAIRWLVAEEAAQLDPLGDARGAIDPAKDPVEGELASAERDSSASERDGSGYGELAMAVLEWARQEAEHLGFASASDEKLSLTGAHASFRQAQDRQPQPEVVLQISQRRRDLEDQRLDPEDRPHLRAGTTVVATMDGAVRYVIAKPLPEERPAPGGAETEAEQRLARSELCLDRSVRRRPGAAYESLRSSRELELLHLSNGVV